MFQALRFIVCFGPGKADHVGEQHFRQLMTQRHAFGNASAFAREINAAVASDRNQIAATHPLKCGGHRRRGHVQFFSKTRADRRLAFFE